MSERPNNSIDKKSNSTPRVLLDKSKRPESHHESQEISQKKNSQKTQESIDMSKRNLETQRAKLRDAREKCEKERDQSEANDNLESEFPDIDKEFPLLPPLQPDESPADSPENSITPSNNQEGDTDTALEQQENKTAEAIKGKMDAELESVTINGNIDQLPPEVQSRVRTEVVRFSIDPQSLPDETKREILRSMTGPNSKPLDMSKVDLNALTSTQKEFILNSDILKGMSSTAVEEYKIIQDQARESGKPIEDSVLQEFQKKFGLPNLDALNLADIRPNMSLSEYPSNSQIGIVQRVLAESTFRDLQNTLGKDLQWSHIPDTVKRELLLESFLYDPAKNSPEVEQALREAKLTVNNLTTERRQGENEEQFARRVQEKTGFSSPDLEKLSREARKSGLSPLMRMLADFFGPIGAALGMPFWQEYMQGKSNLDGHTSGRWKSDSHLDDPRKPSGVLRSNKRYLDGQDQPGFKIETGGNHKEQAESAAEAIKSNRARYEAVAAKTNVPWELIGALHYRESGLNFNTCLHNGDPLGQKTVRVPAGRGPFSTWEDAAIDALNMKGGLGFNSITESSQLEQVASYAERYNGLGYRNRGLASAYVWSGTEAYTGGMYVSDGVFDRNKKDPRPGIMPIIYNLLGKDESGNDRLVKFREDRSKSVEPSFEDYYTAQNNPNNCGPTACAIVAAKLLGGDPEKLEKQFTSEKPGAMDWGTPSYLLGRLGLAVEQASSLSSSQLHSILQDPNYAVIASVTPKSGLTGGGHITALVGSEQIGDSYAFQNADPNANNIEKGYGNLPGERLENGGAKQFWIVRKTDNSI